MSKTANKKYFTLFSYDEVIEEKNKLTSNNTTNINNNKKENNTKDNKGLSSFQNNLPDLNSNLNNNLLTP